MKEKLEKVIEILTFSITKDTSSLEALQYTQAILNIMQAKMQYINMKNIEK